MSKWEMRNPHDAAWYFISLLCYLNKFFNTIKRERHDVSDTNAG